MGAILKLFTGLPIKVWLYLGLAVALGAGYWYWHHHVFEQGVASMQAKVDAANLRASQAMAENANNGTTIAALQQSQAQCEAGRLADQVAANKALTDHDQAAVLIHAQLVADKAKVQALFDKALHPDCAAWAVQPACTP